MELGNPVDILLTVYRLEVGGNERDLAKLARYIDRARYRVHVACFHEFGERRAELDAAGIPILHLPVTSFLNLSVIPGAARLRRYIRRHHIRLIQAFDAPTSIFVAPLARLFGVSVVISSHQFFRFMIPPLHRRALRAVDYLAHRIVVNAHAIKDHLVRDYRIAPERIFVSHNGVDTAVFFARAEKRPPFLEGASVVIGTLCVFREEKRIELLLEAFARVRCLDPKMKLLLVGDGPMREAWMSLSERLELGESCHFELTTGNVPYWMRCMDVFVLASRSEGFPNSLLEAMACGCAAIGSSVGGVPEMIDDGRTGLLFPPNDSAQLVSRLTALIENPGLRKQLGENAAADVRVRFPMEQAARRMQAFYDSLLFGSNPADKGLNL